MKARGLIFTAVRESWCTQRENLCVLESDHHTLSCYTTNGKNKDRTWVTEIRSMCTARIAIDHGIQDCMLFFFKFTAAYVFTKLHVCKCKQMRKCTIMLWISPMDLKNHYPDPHLKIFNSTFIT